MQRHQHSYTHVRVHTNSNTCLYVCLHTHWVKTRDMEVWVRMEALNMRTKNSAFWGFCSTLLSSEHSGLREKDQTAGCGRPRVSSPSSACLTACWSLVLVSRRVGPLSAWPWTSAWENMLMFPPDFHMSYPDAGIALVLSRVYCL